MTTSQKVIKYVALAFAIFLIFGICAAILSGINLVFNIFGNNKLYNNLSPIYQNEIKENIEIELANSNLIIKNSDSFKIETNNKEINVSENNNTLYIKENKKFFVNFNNNSQIVIYIPENYEFNDIKLEAGAGKIEIEEINSKNTNLNLGAGEMLLKNINSINNTNINGGAGYVNIENGYMNNLNLDLGVGKTDIKSKLGNNSKINMGIGELNLVLDDSIENYKIIANKGIGSIRINNEEIKNDSYYGNGNNIINIDGGIGSINIK